MNSTIQSVLILTLICIFSAALLSYTYLTFNEKIETSKFGTIKEKIQMFFGNEISLNEIEIPSGLYQDNEGISRIIKVSSRNDRIGYGVIIDYPGYKSIIRMLVGVKDGKIIGIIVLENSETPGLGSEITRESFTDQFKGKSVNFNKNEIDTITGATISSNAVIEGISKYISIFSKKIE